MIYKVMGKNEHLKWTSETSARRERLCFGLFSTRANAEILAEKLKTCFDTEIVEVNADWLDLVDFVNSNSSEE